MRTADRVARLLVVIRWCLVLVYAWSAGGKLFWPAQFRAILLGTGMIPTQWANPLVYGLPAFELLLALALAARVLLPFALVLSTFLSTVFAGVHAYLLISGDLVPCGCAGVAIDFSSREGHILLLGLSVAMVLASAVLLFSLSPGKTKSHAASTVLFGQDAGVADAAREIATGAPAGRDSSTT